MTPEQARKLEEVHVFMLNMKRWDRVPFDTQKALSRRFNLDLVPTVTAGSKTATSENIDVDEGGAGTYSVLGPPDSFKLISDADGSPIGYVPIWTS